MLNIYTYISGRTKLINTSCRREFADSVPKELIADSLDVDLPSNRTIVGTTERVNTETIIELAFPQTECPACANGDIPTGAHIVYVRKLCISLNNAQRP